MEEHVYIQTDFILIYLQLFRQIFFTLHVSMENMTMIPNNQTNEPTKRKPYKSACLYERTKEGSLHITSSAPKNMFALNFYEKYIFIISSVLGRRIL